MNKFKKFLMRHLSARSSLLNFCPKQKLTSNGSKPIGLLTRTKSRYSDNRLALGYFQSKLQSNWSNFMIHFNHHTYTHTLPGRKGIDRGELCQSIFWDQQILSGMTKLLANLNYSYFELAFTTLTRAKKSLETELQTAGCP